MTTRVKRGGIIGMMVIAASVLAFGAHAAYASARSVECDPDDPGYVGECPPWNARDCNDYCREIVGTVGNDCVDGCCLCAYR